MLFNACFKTFSCEILMNVHNNQNKVSSDHTNELVLKTNWSSGKLNWITLYYIGTLYWLYELFNHIYYITYKYDYLFFYIVHVCIFLLYFLNFDLVFEPFEHISNLQHIKVFISFLIVKKSWKASSIFYFISKMKLFKTSMEKSTIIPITST